MRIHGYYSLCYFSADYFFHPSESTIPEIQYSMSKHVMLFLSIVGTWLSVQVWIMPYIGAELIIYMAVLALLLGVVFYRLISCCITMFILLLFNFVSVFQWSTFKGWCWGILCFSTSSECWPCKCITMVQSDLSVPSEIVSYRLFGISSHMQSAYAQDSNMLHLYSYENSDD